MVAFDELFAQNHKITELSNVFLYLIKDRSMCDTDIACGVFFNYVEKVREHLEVVDKKMYKALLASPDQSVNNVADRFMAGSQEIKKIFSTYLKTWSKERTKDLVIMDYEAFVKDTEEMFNLVLDRIQRETEHLYPLVRKINKDAMNAA
jgi:succinate dehydrogenase flavin-adding protein (antitoxin of CptAB toxin-antitoxin module)